MQPDKWTPYKNKEPELGQPVQMNIYQSNTCSWDLSWLNFGNDQSFQKRQQQT